MFSFFTFQIFLKKQEWENFYWVLLYEKKLTPAIKYLLGIDFKNI